LSVLKKKENQAVKFRPSYYT